jgi:hypothetical protein
LVTGDSSEQVGLNIPLRFIFKPSYSPHCINTNVVCHFTGQLGTMILTTKYLTFWTRVRKEFLGGMVVVSLIILYNYFTDKKDFGIFGLMILGFGIAYLTVALFKARTFVNEVKIIGDKITVTGHNFGSRWDKELDIKNSDIKIKSSGQGRGNVEYYLRIISDGNSVDINRSFNWDYPSLLTIFHEFKKVKGEKIIFDEKYFLDLMEKKVKS